MNAARLEFVKQVNKSELQHSQYVFPYHYLPHITEQGVPMRSRGLAWGFEYLCYQQHVAELARKLAPDSVLEVGCGDGQFIGSLEGIRRRVGVDLSERAIAFARAFHPEVEFACCPAAELSEQFQLVVAVEVLEHVPDEEVPAFIRSLAERTIVGGHVLICVPSNALPVHRKHYRHYDEALLREQIAKSGAPLETRSIEHVYHIPRWLDFFLRLTCGSWLVLELPALNRAIWRYIWNQGRVAKPGKGRHLVICLRRCAPQSVPG